MSSFSPQTYSPSLPPELWLKIFDFATWVPEEAVASDRHFRCGSARRGNSYPLLRSSVTTKHSLVLVCQGWRSLATPLLYERILIRYGTALSSLYDTLIASKRDAEVANPLGWWTRRLHVSRQHYYPAETLQDLRNLPDLIRCLPNLAVFSFSITMPQQERYRCRDFSLKPILGALSETCHKTLQQFSLPTSHVIPHAHHWTAFLAASPNLRHIDSPHTLLWKPKPNVPTMPSLVSLTLAAGNCQIYIPENDTNHFPSLRELTYLQEPFELQDETTWEPFLRIYGHNLTKVVLSISGRNLHIEFNMMLKYCPKLVHLDISFDKWSYFRSYLILPPVSVLGLQCRQLQARSPKYRHLLETLTVLTTTALKTVRLLDRRNVNDLRLRHRPVFAELLLLVKSHGIQLEDGEGVTLS